MMTELQCCQRAGFLRANLPRSAGAALQLGALFAFFRENHQYELAGIVDDLEQYVEHLESNQMDFDENAEATFLLIAELATYYSGPVAKELVTVAREVAAAWSTLADRMEEEADA